MREIKFRGKRIDNGGWAYGDLMTEYVHHEGLTIVENGCIYYEVDPKTVGQSLNCTDKYYQEVYQGDRFGGDLGSCYVDWCDKCKSYQVFMHGEDDCLHCMGDLSWRELVELLEEGRTWVEGNIHDNPELLKGDEGE